MYSLDRKWALESIVSLGVAAERYSTTPTVTEKQRRMTAARLLRSKAMKLLSEHLIREQILRRECHSVCGVGCEKGWYS
jgi:hypothetical protein